MDDLYFNKNLIKILKIIGNDNLVPHIIFYGSEGVGKKTLLNLLLKQIFDDSIYNLKNNNYIINNNNNKEIIVTVK